MSMVLYKVVDARSSGEMFRGFEMILKGRDPLDAQQITQRICGVCPVSHGTASILAQDMAYGVFSESGEDANTFLPPGVLINGKPTQLDTSKIYEEGKYKE